jgi:hypothetical protein
MSICYKATGLIMQGSTTQKMCWEVVNQPLCHHLQALNSDLAGNQFLIQSNHLNNDAGSNYLQSWYKQFNVQVGQMS